MREAPTTPIMPSGQPVSILMLPIKIVCMVVIFVAAVLLGYWFWALWSRHDDDAALAERQRKYVAHRTREATFDLPQRKQLVDQFLDHLRRNELAAAYALTTRDFQEQHSLEAFERELEGRAAVLKKPARFLAFNFHALGKEPGQRFEYAVHDDVGGWAGFAIILARDVDDVRINGWRIMD